MTNSMCGKLSKWSLPLNNLLYAFQLNLNCIPMQQNNLENIKNIISYYIKPKFLPTTNILTCPGLTFMQNTLFLNTPGSVWF